ncbi:Alkyl transferase [Psidium guajava]|nr:Alkyl transferase [Psidium guajava]
MMGTICGFLRKCLFRAPQSCRLHHGWKQEICKEAKPSRRGWPQGQIVIFHDYSWLLLWFGNKVCNSLCLQHRQFQKAAW